MPYYDYKCNGCGEVFEQVRKTDDRDAEVECPTCKSGTLVRQLSKPLIGYSTTVPGSYSRSVDGGWKEVLKKVHSAPGARQTSNYL